MAFLNKIGLLLLRQQEYDKLLQSIDFKEETLSKAMSMIEDIHRGQLDNTYKLSEDSHPLLQTIVKMRDQWQQIALEESHRKWHNEGMASFLTVLREVNSQMSELSQTIISQLVKYVQANQAAIYILETTSDQQQVLEMVACYAYGRKKYLSKQILIGEGLVGQCYLENETTLIKEIPKDYLAIGSGLGDAKPRCLLLVPLQVNGNTYGVLEIASFKVFEPYQIDFIEKLCENIAGTISSVKMNQKTQALLESSIEQTQFLTNQEEEMRQNLEELAATQEEMLRKEQQMHELVENMRSKEKEVYEMAAQSKEEIENLHAEIERLQLQIKRKDKKIESLETQIKG